MSGISCPHCGKTIDVFSRVAPERSIWALGVERLAQIPMDPTISEAGDVGRPLLISHPDSVAAVAFRELALKVKARLETVS